MNLNEIAAIGGVSVTVSASDLKQFAKELVCEARIDAVKQMQAQQNEKYLSRKEVAERLKVDLSTLHRWNQSGYLCAVKVGSKVRYLLSDVTKLEKGEL